MLRSQVEQRNFTFSGLCGVASTSKRLPISKKAIPNKARGRIGNTIFLARENPTRTGFL